MPELSILSASEPAVDIANESPLCLYLICPLLVAPESPKSISQILVVSGTLICKSIEPEVEFNLAKVLPVPSTSSKKFGELVPIPTLCELSTLKASDPAVSIVTVSALGNLKKVLLSPVCPSLSTIVTSPATSKPPLKFVSFSTVSSSKVALPEVDRVGAVIL